MPQGALGRLGIGAKPTSVKAIVFAKIIWMASATVLLSLRSTAEALARSASVIWQALEVQ
jgi:hypothetical protein